MYKNHLKRPLESILTPSFQIEINFKNIALDLVERYLKPHDKKYFFLILASHKIIYTLLKIIIRICLVFLLEGK